jgi:hypothetical protein
MLNEQQLNNRVAQIRGIVLHHCAFVEKVMDQAVSKYFCPNIEKQDDLLNFILCTERITCRSKLDIFRLIVEKEAAKKGDNKYFKFKNKYPNYYKEMVDCVIEERNIFAHYLFDSMPGYVERFNNEKKIGFIKFKVSEANPKIHVIEYDNDKIDRINNTIKKYGNAIIKLNDDMASLPLEINLGQD